MDILILRHGEADPRDAGIADERRQLTRKGRQAVRDVCLAARRAKVIPDLLLTSPLARARQSAEVAAEVFGQAAIAETGNLLPSARPELLWKEIAARDGEARCVLVAGHEPHLSEVAAFLLKAFVTIDFKKGALLRISVDTSGDEPVGVLKWMLTPRLARS